MIAPSSRSPVRARLIGLGLGGLIVCLVLVTRVWPLPAATVTVAPATVSIGPTASTAASTVAVVSVVASTDVVSTAVVGSPTALLTALPIPSVIAAVTTEAISHSVFLPYVTRLTGVPPLVASEWTQEAHDAQRTGYTTEEPVEPWALLWTWNGPDASGGSTKHVYNAPREGRTVTGGGNIYVPAGAQGLYALSMATGQVVWNLKVTNVSFTATPAYDGTSASVFAGATDGRLYKVSATGMAQSYLAGNPINRSVLLVGNYAYVVTDDGHVHKVDAATMTSAWVYAAGSAASTALAYSATRDVIILGTADLNVHAVNNGDGTKKWKVNPSANPAIFPYTYGWYWPVVADTHGVVFLRMRLQQNQGLWDPGLWPDTNSKAREILVSQGGIYQNLFALNLDDGTKKFIPAVGDGGTEETITGKNGPEPLLVTGPLPVVRRLVDGTEIAYSFFRNRQTTTPPPSGFDARWDSHLGEMVLDNATVPGLVAGDLRFVRSVNAIVLTDELNPLTMAGNTIFHAHWGASESVKITNRGNTLGLTYANPIATTNHPTVIRRQSQVNCNPNTSGNKNTTTHWTPCGLTLFDDTRFWSGPGWWTYWNVIDPPTPVTGGLGYSDGMRPRYTYVSAGVVVVEGNGGELMVFSHK
jgi:outer membrane protein assembly factor BamB